jgi:hypothetical protein
LKEERVSKKVKRDHNNGLKKPENEKKHNNPEKYKTEDLLQDSHDSVLSDIVRSSSNSALDKKTGDLASLEFTLTGDGEESSKKNETLQAGGKMRRLKRMLDEAEKKRRRLDDLKRLGVEGTKRFVLIRPHISVLLSLSIPLRRANSEQWVDALKEASGVNVTMNAAKLKKAIKKREKAKEKSAREWKDRNDTIAQAKSARIEKREENLGKRKRGEATPKAQGITTNKGTSQKTQSQRAGFEGKKSEFLNKGKKG